MMPTNLLRIYSIYENGEKIGEGTVSDLALWFDMKPKSIRKAVKNGELIDGYEIKMTDHRPKHELEARKVVGQLSYHYTPQPKSKEMTNLEYLKHHLILYGNTGCYTFDPVPYLPMLSEEGIECRVREIIERKKVVGYYVERV